MPPAIWERQDSGDGSGDDSEVDGFGYTRSSWNRWGRWATAAVILSVFFFLLIIFCYTMTTRHRRRRALAKAPYLPPLSPIAARVGPEVTTYRTPGGGYYTRSPCQAAYNNDAPAHHAPIKGQETGVTAPPNVYAAK